MDNYDIAGSCWSCSVVSILYLALRLSGRVAITSLRNVAATVLRLMLYSILAGLSALVLLAARTPWAARFLNQCWSAQKHGYSVGSRPLVHSRRVGHVGIGKRGGTSQRLASL